jgi:organic radical activating enzyme
VIAAPSYRVTELFRSLQGEGPSAGTPACFIRLQGCDVGCHWCDTKYSWDSAGGRAMSAEDLWRAVSELGKAPLLVVTGGEPLEHPGIAELLDAAVERWPRVEVETSGVDAPPRSHPRLHYNVSPKLASATPQWERTWAHVAAWSAEPRATFKLVIADEDDYLSARALIERHALPRPRVMLMPEGMTEATLKERSVWLADRCRDEGLRLSPRLHVWLWGARRGT